jgi:hypothetical protein
MKRNAIVFLLLMAAAAPLLAQSAPAKEEARRAQVLVLGVYHMSNPGHDIFNMQADDVLSAKRQQEIERLTAVLKKFQPTKIAVEAPYGEDAVPKRYADYLAGTHALTRNETEQIGFRLAKELGHKTIYGVDVDVDFPFPRLTHYAKAIGQSAKLEAMMGEIGKTVKVQDEYLKAHTVLETLVYMNSDQKVAEDIGFYHLMAHYGEPGDYAGPDLLTEWYRRNVRIFNNVAKLAATPEDCILVIYGAGHLGWLRQDVASDPTLRLRKLEEFVPASAAGAAER